jgi:RNA polymerase sigma factor (TIGR02999 family)
MNMNPDSDGLNDLVQTLYSDLHRLAARQLRTERPNHTLQPTALLNEVYLKLSGNAQRQFTDRSHFLAVASRVMRQVLVDYAKGRATEKRGGGKSQRIESEEALDKLQLATNQFTNPVEILELNGSLEALSLESPELAELIELRYFGGMTAEETAAALGRSVHVVRHDLRLAHAWLRRELSKK